MRTILPARRVTLLIASAIPFLVLPILSAWSVGPLARVGARFCRALTTGLPSSSSPTIAPAESNSDGESADRDVKKSPSAGNGAESAASDEGSNRAPRPFSNVRRSGSASLLRTPADPNGHTRETGRARASVIVGPDSIQRADHLLV
jgi:hypothetical protein